MSENVVGDEMIVDEDQIRSFEKKQKFVQIFENISTSFNFIIFYQGLY
jgi:hypothetical protein